jgi:acyl-CoA synthetase (AMP-forming)/AMP-acid ligase II/acyl carrier protein
MPDPCSLFELILNESSTWPQAPAILSLGKETLTYGELSRHLQSITLQLSRLGFREGDRLAVVLPNGSEMATAFLAISSVCSCAPLNPAYPFDEFLFSLSDLHVKALVALPGSDAPAHKAAAALGIPVLILEPDSRWAGKFSLSCSIPAANNNNDPILADMEAEALVLHTSGTTSRPKIVPLTHRNIFYSARNIVETYALTREDVCLNMMPLFHIHGLMGALCASLAAGGSLICAPGFLPDQLLGWFTGLEPTWYSAVPTIHQSILEMVWEQPDICKQVHLRFIRSCSSSLAPQLAQEMEEVFKAPVLEAYGMTEATHQIASNPLPPQLHKFGSVGLATGTVQLSIWDEKGNTLPANTSGEICIRGENVVKGYENNPAANLASFSAGWLRTGDRGFLDEDGYLFIQGRFKEIINRGGEKISPREIDEVLQRHPAVRQAVAFAVPHPSLGEDVAAAVVLQEGQTVSVQELRQAVAARLASFKVPRQIVFVQEIPKGATGKIQRIGLAEKLKTELEAFSRREAAGTTAARTPLEADLLAIWEQVLENERIGVQDDFLALGGNSIQAARILGLVNERFGLDLQLIEFFTTSTVATIADLINIIIDQKERHDQHSPANPSY